MKRKHGVLSLMLTALLGAVTGPLAHAHDEKAPIGDAIAQVPLFDAHVHYKQEAWDPFPVETVIELFDRNGVAMALVSSTPDEGTIRLWEFAPNRIVPELRPYHDGVTSSNWTSADGIFEYLKKRMETYPHAGIGEFHIRSEAMWNEPLMRKVIALARERDVPLHIHSGADPVRWVFSVDQDVKVIWAHAGLGERPAAVRALMAEFPNLYADTSLREYEILGNGPDLDPEWKDIILTFQDRLMVGSDTWVNGQWEQYSDIMDSNRRWLAKLPRAVAEKIAYRNAERYFGRKISMEQIGTK